MLQDGKAASAAAQLQQHEDARVGAMEVACALLDRVLLLQDAPEEEEGPGSGAVTTSGTAAVFPSLGGRLQRAEGVVGPPAGPGVGGPTALAVEHELLRCLMALHALCCADPALCMPHKDPARFVRCLAPYLKLVRQLYQLLQPNRCSATVNTQS